MGPPEKHIPTSLEEALAVFKRDPAKTVRARVEPPEMPTTKASDDVLNGATWHGESAAELVQIIRDGREIDDPAEERPDHVESPSRIL